MITAESAIAADGSTGVGIEVGVSGNPEHESDHERGIRFTSGYSPALLCTPNGSILCGTTAARSGTEFRSPWVPADHMTIPKALNANPDYRCAHFGKWVSR